MRKATILVLICAGLLCVLLVLFLNQGQERTEIRAMAAPEAPEPARSSAAQELSLAPQQESRAHEVVETVVAEEGEGQPTEAAKVEPAVGWLHGHILDGLGVRLPRGRVEVFDGRSSREPVAHAEVEGTEREYRISLLAGPAHYVAVEPSSVEDFGVPPLVRGFTNAARDSNGALLPGEYSRARIVLAEGETIQRDFSVGRPCEVVGRLIGQEGEPLSGVLARVTGMDADVAGNAQDATTDEGGVFRFHHLFPGTYRLAFHPQPGPEGFVPPVPPDFVLADGESRDLGDIRVPRGTCAVIGRVLDQDGRPFPDLPIACYPNSDPDEKAPHGLGEVIGRARTGPDGTFRLEDLPAIPCKISLTPDYVPRVVPGQPAFWEPAVEVFLTAKAPVVDVGVHVVHQSRPFRLEGLLLEKTPGEHRRQLRITVSQIGEPPVDGPRRASLRRAPVSVNWNEGTFECLVETPRPGIELRLELKGYKDLVFELEPEPLGTWSKDIRIPEDFEKQDIEEQE
jgi:protocatechuate 3,4-dioxygenase beta subunit